MKMNKPLGLSHIKTGQKSVEYTPADLYDRIINLKFIRKSAETFVIRSDYEPVFHNDGRDGSVQFKKCTQKPDIKITYKQVANSVGIEVDIRITNFHILGADSSKKTLFTSGGDPVRECVIQMGYRRQFPDWTDPKFKTRIKDYYSMNNLEDHSYGRQIKVMILTGYPESYPPDRVMYFKGVVGTVHTGLRWTHDERDLLKLGYGDPAFPKEFNEIEKVLYQFVTRRFIRPGVEPGVDIQLDQSNLNAIKAVEGKKYTSSVKVPGLNTYTDPGSNALDRLEASRRQTAKTLTGNAQAVDVPVLENGLMPVETANAIGVVCVVSNTLRSMAPNELIRYGLPEKVAERIGVVKTVPFDDLDGSLGGQLLRIQQHYPYIRWYQLTDGSFYFYHVLDTDMDLWIDPYVKAMQERNTVPLPAIYDMTPSGTRTIRCPFISFISPMTTVLFQSRYSMGTLVSFFYPVKTYAFLVILADIEFSTTGDENQMTLTCIDIAKEQAPKIDGDGRLIVKEADGSKDTPVTKAQKERNLWRQVTKTVVLHRHPDALETDSRWENIVKNDVLPNRDLDNFPELANWSEKDALAFLRDANPDYFDNDKKYMKRGNSIENWAGIGRRTGIKVPWLYTDDIPGRSADRITMRWPVRPEYNSDTYYPPDEEDTAT